MRNWERCHEVEHEEKEAKPVHRGTVFLLRTTSVLRSERAMQVISKGKFDFKNIIISHSTA